MAETGLQVLLSTLTKRNDLMVAVGVIIVIMMLIIPLPTVLLDLLMIMNLVISLITILIVLYTKDALEFSVFPTILLVLTVFGLALNVSSTRLILAQGAEFNGRIIKAFSNFVVGTSGTEGLVIGIIIFIIIVAVQFIVITKGSTRVAEVAARFTLDSLPGKQMAIEAEYNSGVITEEDAHIKKLELEREVDFYGAMDGASKFVSGNVKVGILITVVNIVGGIIVGTTIRGETIGVALNSYFALAIGDGLVTQFPALLISTATGLIVTRAISDSTFGDDITKQFSQQSRIFLIAAVFLLLLAFLPGFPWYLMAPLAGLSFMLGLFLIRRDRVRSVKTIKSQADGKKKPDTDGELPTIASLDTLSLEIGLSLIPLVSDETGAAELLDRIVRIRREIALDLGLVVPKIRIVDNVRLVSNAYSFKVRGIEIGSSTVQLDNYLCISPFDTNIEVPGQDTTDPTFGLPAKWISEEYRERAEREGYTVVDSPSVIATHLTELIKRNSADILGRQQVKVMLNALQKESPAVVEDVEKVLGLGDVQKIFQGLLKERVSIRNLTTILEIVSDFAQVSKKTDFLIEKARQGLKNQISQQYAIDKTIKVLTLEPKLEAEIIDAATESGGTTVVALNPDTYQKFTANLNRLVKSVKADGVQPIVLCSEVARPLIKKLTTHVLPSLTVLSAQEIAEGITVQAVDQISTKETVYQNAAADRQPMPTGMAVGTSTPHSTTEISDSVDEESGSTITNLDIE